MTPEEVAERAIDIDARLKAFRRRMPSVLGLPCICMTPTLHTGRCVALRELVYNLDGFIRAANLSAAVEKLRKQREFEKGLV